MASRGSVVDTHLLRLKERVANIKPFDQHNSYRYKVTTASLSAEIDVEASSLKEAVLKFAYCLKELGIGNFPSTASCENIARREKVEYTIRLECVEGVTKPFVTLERILERGNGNDVDSAEQEDNETNVAQQQVPPVGNNGDNVNQESLIMDTLRSYFGFDDFRPLQKDIIIATLSGKNVLGVLATGSGKSLTFLLPSVLATRPTLIVSPTKSLIDDLLVRCQDLNITACKFTGEVPSSNQEEQLQQFESYRIILVTPEMCEEGPLCDKIESASLERIVFDEAHTICSWGSTFRPLYKVISQKLSKHDCPTLLLSATVPKKHLDELEDIFGHLTVFRDTVFRDNLTLEVVEKPTGNKFYDELASYIRGHSSLCGIVYCVLPADVSKIHAELIKRNIVCVKYHGQLAAETKTINFAKWKSEEVKVIVANSAFGMGIDKSNVRFVCHVKLPTGLDDYYQQCGRAGRDNLPASCRLYYCYTDRTPLMKMFSSQKQLDQQIKPLDDLVNYLEDPVQCRHKSIMQYYGEERDGFTCGTSCDNCLQRGTYVLTDGSVDAHKVVQAVVQLAGRKVSPNMLKLFLAGSRQKCIQETDLDTLSLFGSLSKRFASVSLLDKFLHLLKYFGVLSETVETKHKSISIVIGLGENAHLVFDHDLYVPRYEKC